MFPAGSGQQRLESTNSDESDIEVLAVKNTDGSVVVMIANHAVASPTDNNGSGLSAKISLDVSALGSFASAALVIIDSTTSPATGPTSAPVSPSSPISVTLDGYSVAILKLQ